MSKKRFIKLLMSMGFSRNNAEEHRQISVLYNHKSYQNVFKEIYDWYTIEYLN